MSVASISKTETQGIQTKHPFLRPKDAASIILFDRSDKDLKVLVGKRASAHVFMPDVFVFPGGKRDSKDYSIPFSSDLKVSEFEKLQRKAQRPLSKTSARALALAAARELEEETGLQLSSKNGNNNYELSKLRYIARAITPPGQARRYDTRFFTCFIDEIGINANDVNDTNELQKVHWLNLNSQPNIQMAPITRLILKDVANYMLGVNSNYNENPAWQYTYRQQVFHREFI